LPTLFRPGGLQLRLVLGLLVAKQVLALEVTRLVVVLLEVGWKLGLVA
jgi:hypothetical protein